MKLKIAWKRILSRGPYFIMGKRHLVYENGSMAGQTLCGIKKVKLAPNQSEQKEPECGICLRVSPHLSEENKKEKRLIGIVATGAAMGYPIFERPEEDQ